MTVVTKPARRVRYPMKYQVRYVLPGGRPDFYTFLVAYKVYAVKRLLDMHPTAKLLSVTATM